tara:strand:+ start:343 stop:606 length:264 start_codon:yes stop_codon:yes gene_type:complete
VEQLQVYNMNNLKYAILNTSDIGTVDFSKIKQEDANSVRKSLDGSKFIVKFEGDTPDFLDGETLYTQQEILNIVHNISNGWQTEDED